MGVDEIHLGKQQKFLTVVSNLETGEPLWFGRERKKETLDEFFGSQLSRRQRGQIEAACVDMWKPFRMSIEQWAPNCQIVYDKFHIMQDANQPSMKCGGPSFSVRVGTGQRQALVAADTVGEPHRRKATGTEPALCAESETTQGLPAQRKPGSAMDVSLRRRYGGVLPGLDGAAPLAEVAALRKARSDVALDGILSYCRIKVPLGVVEAVNGNIKSRLRRGRGYKNLRYLLLKAQRMAATKTEFVVFSKAA
jgi:hypothetical protein